MERTISVQEGYLYIPVYPGKDSQIIELYKLDDEGTRQKVLEFNIPVDLSREEEYPGDYLAEIPVQKYLCSSILIKGNFPMIMGMKIENSKKKYQFRTGRPEIHFTVSRGWTNDPNGLVYKDGLYHMYFQHNPFNTVWDNMSWGHAVSKDLLHWAQLDDVMFPDEDGSIFSGSAIINERGLLGLPEDAYLYFYTASGGCNPWSKEQGKDFTQKMAYSLDMGETFHKGKEACIPTIYRDNRDPKVFWHEESQAYIMVLWMKGNDFGIFRSTNLSDWELSQEIYLEDGWECPDLFCLSSSEGEKRWFFWCAEGYYFPGEFDGYTFRSDGERHRAYLSRLPYAAQTFSGISGRVVQIPWLRMENDGRLFTGVFGIPTELSYRNVEGRSFLVQRPVREFYEQLVPVRKEKMKREDGWLVYENSDHDSAFVCRMELSDSYEKEYRWVINGSDVVYRPDSGEIHVDGERYQTGASFHKLEFIVDDRILDIVFNEGEGMGTFTLKNREISFSMPQTAGKDIVFQEIM